MKTEQSIIRQILMLHSKKHNLTKCKDKGKYIDEIKELELKIETLIGVFKNDNY